MKIVFVVIFWGILSVTGALLAQDSVIVRAPESEHFNLIQQIVISGNDHTREFVILREMKLKPGQYYDPSLAESDRKRIQNLGLFSRVEIQPIQRDDGIILLIWVAEQWYIFPYPILFRNERSWSRISYGLGIVHANFRGRNERLSASGWAGYNPALQLSYQNPRLFGLRDWSGSINCYYSREASLNLNLAAYDKKQYGIMVDIGRRFGYHVFWNLSMGYKSLQIEPNVPSVLLSPSGVDKIPRVALSFRYDTRDLFEYPKQGWYFGTFVTKNGFKGHINYWTFGADLRRYTPIFKGLALALRTATVLSHRTVPVYDHVYIGYSERIRGHFTKKWEGENRLLGSAELRIPILPIRYFELESASGFTSQYLQNMKFGLSAGIFFDTGTVWSQETAPERIHLKQGLGAGLHIHLPYINLLRLELGFDERFRSEYIVDAQVSF